MLATKLITLAIRLLFTSCKKELIILEGTMSGTVIDKITKLPVSDARIFLRHLDKCNGDVTDDCWTTLDSTSYMTDSLGRFTISYQIETEVRKNNFYLLAARPIKEGYFNPAILTIGDFSPGTDSIIIELWPMTCI